MLNWKGELVIKKKRIKKNKESSSSRIVPGSTDMLSAIATTELAGVDTNAGEKNDNQEKYSMCVNIQSHGAARVAVAALRQP